MYRGFGMYGYGMPWLVIDFWDSREDAFFFVHLVALESRNMY